MFCGMWWGREDAGVLTSLEKGTGDGTGAGLGMLCRSSSGDVRAGEWFGPQLQGAVGRLR